MKIWKHRMFSCRFISILCALWLIFLLLPLSLLCFDAYPAGDDFYHLQDSIVAYAESGSLFQALKAAIDHTASMYQNWQGTFVAMFLSSFQPAVISTDLYFVTPLCALIFLVLSCWLFSAQLVKNCLQLSAFHTFLFFTLFLTLLLCFCPGTRESIYWLSGCPYTIGIILFLLLASILMKSLNAKGIPQFLLVLAAFLVSFLAGGCPYPVALGTFVASGCFCFWSFLRKNKARITSVLSFIGITLSLILVVLAPGNAVRQAKCGEPMQPFTAIISSIAECAEIIGGWFSPQLAAVAFLLALFFLKPLQTHGFRFHYPLLFTVFSFGALAAAFVPPVYATGVEGIRVDRILSSLYMLYVPFMMLNLVYWIGWLGQIAKDKFSLPEICGITSRQGGFFAVMLLWGFFTFAIMASPPIAAYTALLNGSAQTYHSELKQRETLFQTCATYDEAASAIRTLSVQPVLLYEDRIASDVQQNINAARNTARLLRIQAAVKNEGAGTISSETWEEIHQFSSVQ